MFTPVFSLAELLQLIGLAQCVAGVAFMLARGTGRRRGWVPALYYTALGGLFAALFLGAGPFGEDGAAPGVLSLSLALQALLPAATCLLAVQVSAGQPPAGRWLLLLLAPLPEIILMAAAALQSPACTDCWPAWSVYRAVRVISAGLQLLVLQVWLSRFMSSRLSQAADGRERYWLVTALVGLLTLTLGIDLLNLMAVLPEERAIAAVTVLALTFVYLVVTLLFRVTPGAAAEGEAEEPVLEAAEAVEAGPPPDLTDQDRAVIARIGALLTLDKVYQDANCSRETLARELGLPEHRLSFLVKAGFGRGVRQLLNEHRVAEAQALLAGSDQPVSQVAFDVGFNSLPSFNRVFKAATGLSPSDYRAAQQSQQGGAEPGPDRVILKQANQRSR
jgi:AraC-like DNA-binding protein